MEDLLEVAALLEERLGPHNRARVVPLGRDHAGTERRVAVGERGAVLHNQHALAADLCVRVCACVRVCVCVTCMCACVRACVCVCVLRVCGCGCGCGVLGEP